MDPGDLTLGCISRNGLVRGMDLSLRLEQVRVCFLCLVLKAAFRSQSVLSILSDMMTLYTPRSSAQSRISSD
jgi:hypothetical protein